MTTDSNVTSQTLAKTDISELLTVMYANANMCCRSVYCDVPSIDRMIETARELIDDDIVSFDDARVLLSGILRFAHQRFPEACLIYLNDECGNYRRRFKRSVAFLKAQ